MAVLRLTMASVPLVVVALVFAGAAAAVIFVTLSVLLRTVSISDLRPLAARLQPRP